MGRIMPALVGVADVGTLDRDYRVIGATSVSAVPTLAVDAALAARASA